jgi:hypothetical protein
VWLCNTTGFEAAAAPLKCLKFQGRGGNNCSRAHTRQRGEHNAHHARSACLGHSAQHACSAGLAVSMRAPSTHSRECTTGAAGNPTALNLRMQATKRRADGLLRCHRQQLLQTVRVTAGHSRVRVLQQTAMQDLLCPSPGLMGGCCLTSVSHKRVWRLSEQRSAAVGCQHNCC